MLADLKTTAEGFVRAGTDGRIIREVTAFMRYAGQGWEIPVTLPDRDFTIGDVESLRVSFRDNYARFFGRAIDGLDGLEIEIVTWSVKAQDERPAPQKRRDNLRSQQDATRRQHARSSILHEASRTRYGDRGAKRARAGRPA